MVIPKHNFSNICTHVKSPVPSVTLSSSPSPFGTGPVTSRRTSLAYHWQTQPGDGVHFGSPYTVPMPTQRCTFSHMHGRQSGHPRWSRTTQQQNIHFFILTCTLRWSCCDLKDPCSWGSWGEDQGLRKYKPSLLSTAGFIYTRCPWGAFRVPIKYVMELQPYLPHYCYYSHITHAWSTGWE